MMLHVLFVALLAGTAAVFSGLTVLNVRHCRTRLAEVGRDVAPQYTIDDPDRVVDYTRLRSGLGLLREWVGLAALLAVLYSGMFGAAASVVEGLGLHPVAEGIVFLAGGIVGAQAFGMPFEAYSTFGIEEAFDFNNQTAGSWLRDQAVGLVLGLVFTALLGGAVFALLHYLPNRWWLAAWIVLAAFSLALMIIYPRVIAPLFNDFTSVDEGDLRDAVDDVFDRAGFECEQVYTMDASKRSSKANAYFVGFGDAKRVVLFDTLVDQMDTDEMQAVLAHELAHWKRHHIWQRIGVSVLRMGIGLYAVHWLIQQSWLYAMFGVPETSWAGLVLAALWIQPVARLTAPVDNWLSLRHEREADDFAAEIMGGEAMASSLARLAEENLANPFPHPLYETFHHDHPPIPERIRRVTED